MSIRKKSWHSAGGVLDIGHERASTCCGMTTMAAVKVPATTSTHQNVTALNLPGGWLDGRML
ncbi:hypothetical protein ACNKHU_25590 [Shigella flexneri]